MMNKKNLQKKIFSSGFIAVCTILLVAALSGCGEETIENTSSLSAESETTFFQETEKSTTKSETKAVTEVSTKPTPPSTEPPTEAPTNPPTPPPTEPPTEPPATRPTPPPTEPPVTRQPLTEAPDAPAWGYWVNTDSGKFHYSECRTIKDRNQEHWVVSNESREDLINQGYSPCGVCEP